MSLFALLTAVLIALFFSTFLDGLSHLMGVGLPGWLWWLLPLALLAWCMDGQP